MKRLRVALLLLLWATPSLAQARAKYDKIIDQTTVSYFWLLDVPMLGPSKQVDLFYTFPG